MNTSTIHKLPSVFILSLASISLVGCGAGAEEALKEIAENAQNQEQSNNQNNNQNSDTSSLEQTYPIKEDGTLPRSVTQTYACWDSYFQNTYQLVPETDGSAKAFDEGGSLLGSGSFSLQSDTNKINLVLDSYTNQGGQYSHTNHIVAGDTLLAFQGSLGGGYELSCIGYKHNEPKKVTEEVKIQCDQKDDSTVNPGQHDWRRATFTLNTDGSALYRFDYLGNINASYNETNPGTYLYDSNSGKLMMTFGDFPRNTSETVEKRDFEGTATQSSVNIPLNFNGNSLGCKYID